MKFKDYQKLLSDYRFDVHFMSNLQFVDAIDYANYELKKNMIDEEKEKLFNFLTEWYFKDDKYYETYSLFDFGFQAVDYELWKCKTIEEFSEKFEDIL